MKFYPALKTTVESDLKNIRSSTNKRVIDAYDAQYPEDVGNITKTEFPRYQWGQKEGGAPAQKPISEMTDEELKAELNNG